MDEDTVSFLGSKSNSRVESNGLSPHIVEDIGDKFVGGREKSNEYFVEDIYQNAPVCLHCLSGQRVSLPYNNINL